MKKLKYWFFMLFKNGKKAVYEEGGFKVTFRNYDMRIETLSKNFSVKIMAGEYPFGYLAASYAQDKKENIHGYAMFLYMTAMLLPRDDQFRRDLQSALKTYEKRSARKAKEAAEKEDPQMEQIAIEAEKRDAEMAAGSRRYRRRASKEFRQTAKEVMKDAE